MFKDLSVMRILRVKMPRMRHTAAIVLLLLYTAAAILSGTTGSLTLRLVLTSLATATLAAVIFMYRRPVILAFPVIVTAAVLLLTRDFTLASSSLLLPLPAAIAAATSLCLGADKARAVTVTAVSLVASAAALTLIYILSGGTLPSYESFFESLVKLFASLSAPSANGPVNAFTAEAAASLARYIMLSLPAIVFVTVSAVSFVSVTLCSVMIDMFSFGQWVVPESRVYTPSVISAVLYLGAYLISASLVSVSSADVIGYAAENVLLCLLPAMMIHGEKSLYGLSRRHDKKMLFAVLTVALLMLSPSLYLMFVSFSGAIALIYTALRPVIRRLIGRDDDDGSDDDDGDDYYDDWR